MNEENGKSGQIDQSSGRLGKPAPERSGCKDFLETNRIFVEVFAAVCLSAMALIVSIAQLRLSSEQTHLSHLQTEIAKAQVIPQFTIDSVETFGELDKKVTDEKLLISNLGGLARNFESKYAVLVDVSYMPKTGSQIRKSIPVIGFYSVTRHIANNSGLMEIIKGHHNRVKTVELDRQFRYECARRGGLGDMKIKRYVRLRYQDVLGQNYEKYFMVDSFNGGLELSSTEGERLFATSSDAAVQSNVRIPEEFNQLTANQLLSSP